MRYLILADIHANIDALDAVLAAAPAWDRVLVLGDLVGYGAAPNEVVDRVVALSPTAVIRGNHDKAACGIDDGSNFNQVARVAATWTLETLTDDNRQYLRDLSAGPLPVDPRLEICHGSPFDEDHYIFDGDDALRALEASRHALCLFAHTHLPVVFRHEDDEFDGFIPDDARRQVQLAEEGRYLINVGSVGQPRDADPRAAFGIYDDAATSVSLERVDYPVDAAQRRILRAGLPASLANRLAVGR